MKLSAICRRVGIAAGVFALMAGTLSAMMPSAVAAEWPERPITFVVGFGIGGSADRTARGLSTFIADELGQPVKVVNKPGAGGQLAATYVLGLPADGYTVFATAMSPYLANSIIHGGAKYSLDDFAFINAQWSDWDIILMSKDRPFKTLVEFLNAVRDNPKKHSVSIVPNSSGHLHTLMLLDAAKIPRENLNIVTYQSGGAARAAVSGGQVDITIQSGEGSESIREFTTPLAVIRPTRHKAWDAPTLAEAIKPLGVSMTILNGSMRGLLVRKEVKEKYPDRYQKLVDAYAKTLERKEVKKFFKRSSIGADWLGPEKTTEIVYKNYEILKKFKDLIKK